MPELSLIILYVDSSEASARSYAGLLGCVPVEQSPTFVMFRLASGTGLGPWSRHTVEPAALAAGGGTELASASPDIDALHADWRSRGLQIAQAPVDLHFGRTLVAFDPDGHRLRVFAPGGA